MIRNPRGVVPVLAAWAFLVFSAFGQKTFAQSQGEQQPSTGPKPSADETVLVPKKTQPGPPPPARKPPEKINPKEVFTLSATTNLINVDVSVLDKNGYPISSLTRKNFKVLDDGVTQTLSNFSTTEAPLTVCMLIEFSNKSWVYLYLALEDAYQFINYMQPKDWVAVVDFDMQPHILTDFTQDRYQVRGERPSLASALESTRSAS